MNAYFPQRSGLIFLIAFLLCSIVTVSHAAADPDDKFIEFDDTLLEEELVYPDWFKLSIGDLNEDIKEGVQVHGG